MYKRFIVVVLVVFIVSIGFVYNSLAEGQNILINGEFEEWDDTDVIVGDWKEGGDNIKKMLLPYEWGIWGWGDRKKDTTVYEADSEVYHSGTYSARIEGVSQVVSQAAYTNTPVIEENISYKLSGWIKTELEGGQHATINAILRVGNTTKTQYNTKHITGVNDWTYSEIIITLKDMEDVTSMYIYCAVNGSNEKGKAWFDDIKLEEIEDSTNSL